jgi:hypothetical protein
VALSIDIPLDLEIDARNAPDPCVTKDPFDVRPQSRTTEGTLTDPHAHAQPALAFVKKLRNPMQPERLYEAVIIIIVHPCINHCYPSGRPYRP